MDALGQTVTQYVRVRQQRLRALLGTYNDDITKGGSVQITHLIASHLTSVHLNSTGMDSEPCHHHCL